MAKFCTQTGPIERPACCAVGGRGAIRADDERAIATCCHPGFVASNFGETNGRFMDRLVGLSKVFAVTPQEGAKTQTWLAASPECAGETGGYYAKRKVKIPSGQARDAELARRLWDASVVAVAAAG